MRALAQDLTIIDKAWFVGEETRSPPTMTTIQLAELGASLVLEGAVG